jgi:intracellular sulfur oxidation DsrE/DsrF family protein
MKSAKTNRRTLLSGLGVAAVGVAASAVSMQAQTPTPTPAATATPTRTSFVPARHKEDEWFDSLPGKHRVFIDSATTEEAGDAVLYANNLFIANKSGYGLEDADIATVVCFRHYGTIFGYNNAMWAKYGKTLADSGKYTNPRGADANTANPQRNLDALAKRGVHFAICGLATRRIAGQIAAAVSGNADEIQKELLANIITNGHVMAAGVVATTRAQEYGYSLLIG